MSVNQGVVNYDQILLQYAVKSGNLDLFKYLVEKGLAFNAKDDFGKHLYTMLLKVEIWIYKHLVDEGGTELSSYQS
ncbi:ankyrin repeat domain protein [Wolbachia endosymbiont of Armadillidium vulgare str. wVulC]|uniref:ankyrin repeat domain-containing protein n=1 Tax=Wolbachia endosymbiont of Armadillidium vulgare TaxID=77039 RepID=UPI000649D43C|nr:ankyrin repeat domain-containing protein [Wolbachia endosymbiont of Armadillidium vulgare]KLT22426.1 ankyrin repeat domain protein [Wolbachia endosymbiont of Armadillidium vulgare str. wVulC]